MNAPFADWLSFAGRASHDVLTGRPAVVIPLRHAAVCGDDHVYDVREFNVCPNCASEQRLPLFSVLDQRRPMSVR